MTSIYIPRIGINTDEISMQIVFDKLLIGRVSRVDFVPIDSNTRMKKAFVHMSEYYDTEIAFEIKDAFNNNIAYQLYPDVDSRHYWILLKNKCPIPETTLNVHQLAENHRILEEVVFKQTEQIDGLQRSNERMAEQIERLQQTLEQFLGHTTMSEKQFKMFVDVLYDNGTFVDKGRGCLFKAYRQQNEDTADIQDSDWKLNNVNNSLFIPENLDDTDDEMPALIPIEESSAMRFLEEETHPHDLNAAHVIVCDNKEDETEVDVDDDGFTKC